MSLESKVKKVLKLQFYLLVNIRKFHLLLILMEVNLLKNMMKLLIKLITTLRLNSRERN